MDWVNNNSGKTLADAVAKWVEMEDRKKDPNFRRDIAAHNMLSQYVRDFLADNEGKKLEDAIKFWNLKRQLPMHKGTITYHKDDLEL